MGGVCATAAWGEADLWTGFRGTFGADAVCETAASGHKARTATARGAKIRMKAISYGGFGNTVSDQSYIQGRRFLGSRRLGCRECGYTISETALIIFSVECYRAVPEFGNGAEADMRKA
jgi:protein-arginine kinase activator protein McsA